MKNKERMKNGDYDLIIAPKQYKGKKYCISRCRKKYILESHYVWWKNTGESVKYPYIIHHKNKNTHDNRFKNLEKLHIQEHNFKHHYIKDIKIKCKNCNKIIFLRPNAYRYRKKNNKRGFFCSIRCSALHQFRVRSLK